MSTTVLDFLLQRLHAVVTGYMHYTDFLWTIRLDDDAIRVAIGLMLGANLCDPHVCPCGTFVNNRGHMVYLANEVQANWPDMQLSII